MMLLGGIHMLNDYEIQNLSNNSLNKLISILKLIAASLIVICTFILLPSWIVDIAQNRVDNKDNIKLRVIANSNTVKDQQVKKDVVDTLLPFLLETKDNSIPEKQSVEKVNSVLSTKYKQKKINVKIENHLTPPKWQEGEFYPQAYYNTLVVTIGQGRGDNFWCNIFPDVCKGPSQEDEKTNDEDEEDEEVTFILWEWLKQLFS